MGPGQRYCTHCGRSLRLRGAQTMLRPPRPGAEESSHFRVHYTIPSFAEQDMPAIIRRLETAYSVFAAALSNPDTGGRVDVYLLEVLERPAEPGEQTLTGYAVPERMALYEVFRPDAPGVDLERSLLHLLLTRAIGEDGAIPPLLHEGLLALALHGPDTSPAARWTPQLPVPAHSLPSLTGLLMGPTPETQSFYPAIAAAFTTYLLATYASERFIIFLSTVHGASADLAARAAFGQPIARLEKEWRKSLKSAEPSGVMRFLKQSLRYLRPYWPKVTEIVVYIAVSVAFGIGEAKAEQFLVDRALPGFNHRGDLSALAAIMGILLVAFALTSLTSLRQSYLMAWVTERVMIDLRRRMFANIQGLDAGFIQRMGTGDILSRMTSDLAQVEFGLTGAVAQGLRMTLMLIAAVITIFWLNWHLAILAMIGTPLFFVAGRWLGPRAAKASLENQQNQAAATTTLQENLGALPVVRAFGLQERAIGTYTENLYALFRSSLRLTFLGGIFGLAASSVATAIQLSILGIGGWLIIRGELTIGALVAFLGLMGQIIGPIQNFSSLIQALQQATGAMDRVEELRQAESAVQDASSARSLGRLSDRIRLEQISFSYTGEQQNLTSVTFDVQAGTNVAIVGPSGCGKSTLLSLLLRFYDPQNGRVLVDNVDLREATLASLRGQIGIVFQDNLLFNMSVRDNIQLGNVGATDAEIEAAAKAAEIHDVLVALPQGYDTIVGERGGQLSGGQRQRVAIARAIVRDPAILVLDEATSALDPHTESAINRTLETLSRGRTTITVTHRLGSIVPCDQIFVLDRGQLVERGTHQELLARRGLYAQLWQDQGGLGADGAPQFLTAPAARLHGVPLLAGLDDDILAALAQRLSLEWLQPRDVIIREGESGDTLYFVARGELEVLTGAGTMDEHLLAVLRDGDYFGEIALVHEAPRTATVRARTPAQLFALNRAEFDRLLAAVPGLRSRMEENLTARSQVPAS